MTFLMPCVMDDFAKKHQHFIQHGTPSRSYMTFTQGGGGRILQIFCLYILIKATKHHCTKNLLNDKVLPRSFWTFTYFFKFLLFKLLNLQGSEDARSYMTLVQTMLCGLGLKFVIYFFLSQNLQGLCLGQRKTPFLNMSSLLAFNKPRNKCFVRCNL